VKASKPTEEQSRVTSKASSPGNQQGKQSWVTNEARQADWSGYLEPAHWRVTSKDERTNQLEAGLRASSHGTYN
jgi:hypothetical protein